MRQIKQLLVLFLVFNVFASCEEEEVSYALQDISAPTDVKAIFDISQDEVGLVTLTPAATGASEFHVYFGDDENETPTKVNPGETINHTYTEGEFSLRIIAVGLTGLTSELVRIVTVSLEAPEDLSVNIAISGTNPFEVLVTPSATNAAVFDVYFGDVEDEEATTIMAGETANHEYAEAGDYTIRVVARGAGTATIETSEEVTITGAVNAVTLPITFDDVTVNYAVSGFGASDFGPIPVAVIENPDASGINTTAKVLSVNKTVDAQVWAGASIPLEGPIDFTNGTTISLRVWSPRAGTPILLKIEDSSSEKDENGNPTIFVEVQVNSTLVNTWEELTFDLSSNENFSTSNSYDTIIVFPDFGTVGKGELFYFDDIKLATGDGGGDGPVVATSLPVDFESNQTLSGVFESEQGVTGLPVANPDKSGINTSETVFQFTKATGAAWYSGIYQVFPQNLDLSTNQSFSIKIWSPKAGINVRLNLEKEGEGGGPAVGINQTLTQANTWVTLTYNFTGVVNASEAYDKIVIFPEFDEAAQPAGDGSVYYIDDLEQTTGGSVPTGGKTSFPINFETPDTGGTSAFNVFENVDNPPLEVVSNPDVAGVNTSATVAKFTARAAGEPYAGVETQLNTPFTMDASNSTAKIMVWKSVISDVGIQVVNATDGSTATVIKVSNTVTDQWEELTLDLSAYIGEPGAINTTKLAIFPDWGARSQDNIIYFDNITFSAGTDGGNGSACTTETSESLSAADFNLTFMTNDVAVVQDNAEYVRSANPKEDAVNSSCFVGEVTNLNQNPWDNIQIDLNAKLDFDANAGFKIKVYSLKAGTKVTVKLEEIGNPGSSTEVGVARTKTGEWEELTVPFPSSASGKFNKIVLFFDLESTNGDTYYFDDLKLYPRTDGGGGSTTGDVAENGGFETGNLDGWAVYKNGGTVDADNTQSNSGDWSAKIVASSPAGLNPTIKQERKGAGSVAVGDIVQIKFDYKGAAAAGGIYSIQSFVEAENGVNQTEVFSVTPTATWQTFTTTYTVNAGDVSGGITLEFTSICGGDSACNSTLILDNVSIILNP